MRFHILALAALGLTAGGNPLPGEVDRIFPHGLEDSGSNIGHVITIDELNSGLQSFRLSEKLERRDGISEIVEEFKIDTSTGETYRSFIERMRRRVQDPGVFSHGRPVLPRQQMPPSRWFDVVLRAGSQAVRLRIRSDNLYLDGYRAENSDQWFEFDNEGSDLHLIPGSRHLGFDGGYISLERAAARRRDQTYLGQQQLVTAINHLASTTDRGERARSLLIIIQMICEAIRFTHISDVVANSYNPGFIPDNQITALENGWGEVSAALLRHDQDPEGPIRLPRPNAMNIDSVTTAAALIGILLRYSINTSYGPRRLARALIPEGRPLAEILWVDVGNIDSEEPGDLYGSITATDGLSSQYVYNVDKANYQSIYPHTSVVLTGPSRAISAASSFVIDLNLMDKDDLSRDDKISQGQISWNVYDPSNTYDVPRQTSITGAYGQATVNYVVMSNAAEAVVEVILINGDEETPADIFGNIRVDSKFVQRDLLNRFPGGIYRTGEGYISLRPEEHTPLSRAVMAVPMDDSLKVHVRLWDHDDLSPNDEVAKGMAEFRPQLFQSTKETITGDYGSVEVRVTWS
ncbi:Protein synthesis inhibitor I [Beauveria bassiana D1-5]|uniref:Protein synthesis inhibitor I n=1 Tax=Beauveria bassiana D1-5 TaxID=1245745 RepID=A0A0A2VSE2_BEABA|nr:Protein synthesis inhibitor I [Beauveria bassiana D1-5]